MKSQSGAVDKKAETVCEMTELELLEKEQERIRAQLMSLEEEEGTT